MKSRRASSSPRARTRAKAELTEAELDALEEAEDEDGAPKHPVDTNEHLDQLDVEDYFGPPTVPASESALELEWVYGYDGRGVQNNILYLSSTRVAYTSGKTVIVYDKKTHQQHIHLGHTADTLCMAMHPDGKLVATGQRGAVPLVLIWEADTLQVRMVLQGFHRRGVSHVNFSKNGKFLLTIGADEDHSIAVYEWAKGEVAVHVKGGSETIYGSAFKPDNSGFIHCGYKHIKARPAVPRIRTKPRHLPTAFPAAQPNGCRGDPACAS